MATTRIAEWVENLSADSLPDSVIDAATKSFANYVGCAVGGHKHEATQLAIKSYSRLPQATGTSLLLGEKRLKVDPLQAALINGLASHVHDYDDTHLSTIIHPTAPVASALLAYTQFLSHDGQNLTGKDFICALVAGIEIECLLGLAVWPSHYDVGWHITATVGSIGAAVAVGKAMSLSVEQLVNAIGISSAQSTGMRRHFGTHAKALGVGLAAQAGLQAALLAQSGMTAATDSLEGKRGWIECVCPEQDQAKTRLDAFVSCLLTGKGIDSDGKWEIEKNAFKPFPCGIVIHPAIDGCIQLRREGLDSSGIKSIEMFVHPLVLELTGKKMPKDGLEAKFSVYHGAACGLLFGRASPAEYADAIVAQTEDLRRKITAIIDKDLQADECRIIVHLARDTIEKHVQHAVGSLSSPMTSEQLRQKFADQTAYFWNEQAADEVFNKLSRIWDVEGPIFE